MRTYIKQLNDAVRHFSIIDTGMFKLCLISLGMVLGILFASQLEQVLWLLIVLFVVSWLFIVIKIFGVYMKRTQSKE